MEKKPSWPYCLAEQENVRKAVTWKLHKLLSSPGSSWSGHSTALWLWMFIKNSSKVKSYHWTMSKEAKLGPGCSVSWGPCQADKGNGRFPWRLCKALCFFWGLSENNRRPWEIHTVLVGLWSIIIHHTCVLGDWGAKYQAGGVARALLCMELSGVQGWAPGSLAREGWEAAGRLTSQISLQLGASPSSSPHRWPSRNRKQLYSTFKDLGIVCFGFPQLNLFCWVCFEFISNLFWDCVCW